MTGTDVAQKTTWIRVGDFFFKYRNVAFPVILVVLFVAFRTPDRYFGKESLENWKDALAIAITAAGLALRAAVIGFAYIKRGGLDKKVYAEDLVTRGFFGICRNPLYLGNMLIYAGVFLMHGNPWVFVIGTLSYFLIYESIIAAEEFFLRGKFGAGYEEYCRDVPRWIPSPGKLAEATEGMRFNVKRVVLKDYPTIANACVALLLLQLLETYENGTAEAFRADLASYGTLMLVILVVAIAISVAKKRKWLHL